MAALGLPEEPGHSSPLAGKGENGVKVIPGRDMQAVAWRRQNWCPPPSQALHQSLCLNPKRSFGSLPGDKPGKQVAGEGPPPPPEPAGSISCVGSGGPTAQRCIRAEFVHLPSGSRAALHSNQVGTCSSSSNMLELKLGDSPYEADWPRTGCLLSMRGQVGKEADLPGWNAAKERARGHVGPHPAPGPTASHPSLPGFHPIRPPLP